MRQVLVFSAALLMLITLFAQACDFTPVRIEQSTGKAGDVTVDLGEADDAQHPTAWQGPLRISMGGAPACTVSDDVSIVEEPVLLGGDILYVPTYSGSNNSLYAVNVNTCAVIWHSSHFGGKTVFRKGRLFAGKSEISTDKRCRPLAAGAQ
jgi:hypothetical protein